MALRFIDRVVTLAKADAHGVVEALEERSLLLKQALRDAHLELLQKRARVRALEEEERRLGDEAQRLERELASLDEDVRLALAGDKEELARFAIRRLLPRRREREQLREQLREVTDSRERLSACLAEQEQSYQELASRAQTRLAAERRRGYGADTLEGRLGEDAAVADEEVEIELLRRRRGTPGGEA